MMIYNYILRFMKTVKTTTSTTTKTTAKDIDDEDLRESLDGQSFSGVLLASAFIARLCGVVLLTHIVVLFLMALCVGFKCCVVVAS